MRDTKCTSFTHKGVRCTARTWVIQVGKGFLARTIASSDKCCIRHDEGKYNQALMNLTEQEGRTLRFQNDWRRWKALRLDIETGKIKAPDTTTPPTIETGAGDPGEE